MKYRSKRNPETIATFDSEDEKFGTVMLVYDTGDKVGKSFSISSSTLKRWWERVEDDEEEVSDSILNIDYEKVSKPYKPDVTPHYIPKPQSVVEYEAKKKGRRYNSELPTQEQMVERFGNYLSKINKTYIVFKTNGTWIERKSGYTNVYANEAVWEMLSLRGLQSRANGMKNTKLKFVFKVEKLEEFEIVADYAENL